MKKRTKVVMKKKIAVKTAPKKKAVKVAQAPTPVAPTPAPAAAPAPAPAPKPALVTVQINAAFLRAMRHVAAKQDIRYYLNGVLFNATKDGGKFYVATDGHRIGVLHEAWANGEEPIDVSLIIPRAVCEKATPMLKKASDIAMLKQLDQWTWTLIGGGEIHQTFKAIDGKFPEWERVVPSTVSGAPGAYNWRYLSDFDQLVRDAFGPSVYSCSLEQNGEEGAALVTCETKSFLGVLMPMRYIKSGLPQWAMAVQKENIKRKAKEAVEAEKRAQDQAAAVPA